MRPLPDSVALLVGDAVHNLRSALDHFAYAAVAQPTRQTCFPIRSRDDPRKAAPQRTEWLDTVAKQLTSASPGLIDAVRALSPRETGSDKCLWAIHELDRVDKHRLLLSVAAAHTAVVFEVAPVLNPVPGFRPPTMPVALATRKWTPLEAGIVLWHVPEESKPAPDPIRFEYDVTLGEPEDVRGQPAVAQLRMLANHAETTRQALALLA